MSKPPSDHIPPASPQPPGPDSRLDITLRLLADFQRFAWDTAGVVCLALALMTLLALFDLTGGRLLGWWAGVLHLWFGWGSLLIALAAGIAGLLMLRRQSINPQKIRWGQVFALELAGFTTLTLLSILGDNSVPRAEAGLDGGLVGWGLAELLGMAIKPLWLQGVCLSLVYLFSMLVGLGLVHPLLAWMQRVLEGWETKEAGGSFAAPAGGQPSVSVGNAPNGARGTQVGKKKPPLPAEFRKRFKLPAERSAANAAPAERDERLPPLNLLVNEQAVKADERNINLTAGLIEKTLAEFGIPARVVGFQVGPAVTQFAVEPGFMEKEKPGSAEEEIVRQKVRVAQISALNRDLALALSAERLRIEAPVPGRPYVGIEVPNARSAIVRLRPILESEVFSKAASPLALALGRDVSGQPVVADLARMPHLLIAGTTGSGKSICIAALTTCLVMNNPPEDLRLVMIDPKMVELVRFNGLPHLFGKVETDLERILGVLRWTVAEMDRRYKLLEASRSRNIDTYNRKVRRRRGEQPMPRVVVMIDELADLMMSAPDQTEHVLVRLAQMARATGIHLVVATQRPSTDVVTGLIKANFPARMAFTVASSVDSRVILDVTGAETLLGRGDMLFMPPEAGSPLRSQGVMVTDQEIERVITFWQKAHPEPVTDEPPWEQMLADEAALSDRDDLVIKAAEVVQRTQRASASLLQRRLRIGYPRAARLIDELEVLGFVGPAQSGGKEREVLIGPDDQIDLPGGT